MILVHKFKRLKIRGKWWRFDWDYKGKDFAWCIPEDRTIQINLRKHKSVPQLVNTITHELAHAVAYEMPHGDVRALATAVQRALTEGGIIA